MGTQATAQALRIIEEAKHNIQGGPLRSTRKKKKSTPQNTLNHLVYFERIGYNIDAII